jgi:hypothetical protein
MIDLEVVPDHLDVQPDVVEPWRALRQPCDASQWVRSARAARVPLLAWIGPSSTMTPQAAPVSGPVDPQRAR